MTHEQAATIVARLNAGFPDQTLEPESVDVFTSELALLADPDVAMQAAHLIIRNGSRFPSIKDIRATYRTVAESRRAEVRSLPEPEPRERKVPEWVQVWWWSRTVAKNESVLPQQVEGMLQLAEWADREGDHATSAMWRATAREAISNPEYERIRQRWIAAGSPSVSYSTVTRHAAGIEMPEGTEQIGPGRCADCGRHFDHRLRYGSLELCAEDAMQRARVKTDLSQGRHGKEATADRAKEATPPEQGESHA